MQLWVLVLLLCRYCLSWCSIFCKNTDILPIKKTLIYLSIKKTLIYLSKSVILPVMFVSQLMELTCWTFAHTSYDLCQNSEFLYYQIQGCTLGYVLILKMRSNKKKVLLGHRNYFKTLYFFSIKLSGIMLSCFFFESG